MNYRFRFKTEEEFELEYGENWRSNLGYYCFSSMINGLLGSVVEDTCMLNCIQMMTGLLNVFMIKYKDRHFYITRDMIKYEEI